MSDSKRKRQSADVVIVGEYILDHAERTSESRCEKNGLWVFRQGPTQTGLCSYRRWVEALNFGI